MSPSLRRRILATLAVVAAQFVWTTAASALTSGDAYANQGANSCTWTIGTAGIEKTLTFSSGSFTMTSFKNKLVSPTKELIQGSTVSPEFRFTWDGSALTGASGGWTCASGSAATTTVGGQTAIQLDVTLTRSASPTTVQVTKHYLDFPSDSLIREWTDYKNTDSAAHTLATPSFLEQHLLGTDAAAGHVTLNYMTGAACCNAASWTVRATPLTSSYVRNFDSYDAFGCVDSGSTPASCSLNSFNETSSSYIPWFSLSESTSTAGLIAGFDYFGRWQAPIGASNGDVSLSLNMPNYSASVAAGSTVTSPKAFVMTYKSDLDDMGNRLLDWQYRYLWDDTRSGYFPGVAAPGNWCAGTQWCGNWDQQGIRQKIFNLSDRERAIGIDVDWRDNGWWNVPGDWSGPDFKLTNDFLAKSGTKSIIYYPAYGANTNSQTYAAHSSWFTNGSPCGYVNRLGDMGIPGFETWMENLLVGNAQNWGDYMFRNDACPITATTGDTQLAEDQAYRRILQYYLDQRSGGAFYSVDSGGNELGWDYMRLSSLAQFYDAPDPDKAATAAYLFPVDKISGDPNPWSSLGYCSRSIWRDLGMNLSFYSNADGSGSGAGDTVDPAQIECARQLVDEYHYLTAQGVVGRWVRQYHPTSTDSASNWFERLSQDGNRGAIHRFGADTASSVTVYPKGLNSATTYDVRFQFTSGSSSRTGSDLMTNGITFSSGLSQGEIVYLNLAKHPGGGNDATAPSAASGVTATAATNVNYPGVDVRWTAGSDDNWVSYYNVYRNGTLIGKASKGTYFFDHTPAASPYVQYGVQTVDGDGNASSITYSSPVHGQEITAVDDASLTYTGYAHLTGQVGNYGDTLSSSSTTTDAASYSFTGTAVTLYVKLGPNEGMANVKIDGTTDAVVDLYAPDNLDAIVPIYVKTWAAAGAHTISISPNGTKNAKSSSTIIYVDGIQVINPSQSVTEDSNTSAITYSGTWTHSTGVSSASNTDLSSTGSAGAYAQYTFTSSRVRLIGRYCSSCGEADVYIDGSFDARIDLWGDRGTQVDQTVLYDKSFPTSGSHTVKVVATGTKNLESSGTTVYVDSFQTDNGGTGGGTTGPYASAVTADGPTVWYRLDDSTGSTSVVDASGNGNTGTVHGTVTLGAAGALASEPSTKAATFDGSSGWVDVGNPSSLQVGNGTVEAWIKTTNTDSTYHAVALKWYAY
ncbi:MAG: hypothetical protein JWM06_2721, partial [Actinomycetia bacterium]|nr:hypothetical protein [Actinomycetes bacterium]